jgi:hypothetical protein
MKWGGGGGRDQGGPGRGLAWGRGTGGGGEGGGGSTRVRVYSTVHTNSKCTKGGGGAVGGAGQPADSQLVRGFYYFIIYFKILYEVDAALLSMRWACTA